jgi:serine protease Do
MKKYIICVALLGVMSLLSFNSYSQKTENEKKKSEEIIIRSNGDKDRKMTIQVDGDNITVNGKPLSEYHDGDVTIMKRDYNDRNSRNFVFTPGNQFSYTPGNENELRTFSYNNEPRTFLGVETEKTDDGVKITNVIRGSAAEKAGFQNGDIISKLDEKKITTPEDLMETVRSHKPDDEVKIYYSRDSKKKDAKVKLGETSGNENSYFFKNDSDFSKNFNFKMPRMPRLERLPDMNYNLWKHNTPKLGIKIQDTEDEKGAKVLEVEAGSAAEKAGLQKNDIITNINGEDVNSVDEAREHLDELGDKDSFTVKAKRNNAEMKFDIKIPKQLNSADL